MKKKFNETKVGKFLTTNDAVKRSLDLVPFGIGSLVSSILDKNETEAGEPDSTLGFKLAKIVIYAILVYLVLSGSIGWEDAEKAQDFMNR